MLRLDENVIWDLVVDALTSLNLIFPVNPVVKKSLTKEHIENISNLRSDILSIMGFLRTADPWFMDSMIRIDIFNKFNKFFKEMHSLKV